jgi:hypothetical protein
MSAPEKLGHIEQGDDKCRHVREMVQNSNDWLSVEPSFVDRYVRNELHLVVRRTLPDATQYGFLIQAQGSSGFRDEISRCGFPTDYAEAQRANFDFQKPAVLTHDVKLMEEPKRLVPSLIRFQTFDQAAWKIGKRLYEFRTLESSPGVENHAVSGDRKINVVGLRYAVAVGQRSSENIETASNSVDVSPHLDIERQRQWRFLQRYYRIVIGWRWRLFGADFDVQPEPFAKAFREGWELGYGPIDAGLSV